MVTERDDPSSVTVEEGEPDFIEALLDWQDTILEPARARGERKDPFETVWPEILLWLQQHPRSTAKSLIERL